MLLSLKGLTLAVKTLINMGVRPETSTFIEENIGKTNQDSKIIKVN